MLEISSCNILCYIIYLMYTVTKYVVLRKETHLLGMKTPMNLRFCCNCQGGKLLYLFGRAEYRSKLFVYRSPYKWPNKAERVFIKLRLEFVVQRAGRLKCRASGSCGKLQPGERHRRLRVLRVLRGCLGRRHFSGFVPG